MMGILYAIQSHFLFVDLQLAPFPELEHEKTAYWSGQTSQSERRRQAIRDMVWT
jgi:hypothetical protein